MREALAGITTFRVLPPLGLYNIKGTRKPILTPSALPEPEHREGEHCTGAPGPNGVGSGVDLSMMQKFGKLLSRRS